MNFINLAIVLLSVVISNNKHEITNMLNNNIKKQFIHVNIVHYFVKIKLKYPLFISVFIYNAKVKKMISVQTSSVVFKLVFKIYVNLW